jgi:hypothetical protein
MAQRKGLGYSGATGLGPGFQPALMRAYAEGRRSFPSATNPHVTDTPKYKAWQYGYDNRADSAYQFETQS